MVFFPPNHWLSDGIFHYLVLGPCENLIHYRNIWIQDLCGLIWQTTYILRWMKEVKLKMSFRSGIICMINELFLWKVNGIEGSNTEHLILSWHFCIYLKWWEMVLILLFLGKHRYGRKKNLDRILSISHCKNFCDSICLLDMVFHESEQPSSWVFCCMTICRKSP